MPISHPVALIVLAGALGGASYVFVPAGGPSRDRADRAAIVAIPQALPAGRIELTSFGIAELTPDELPAMQMLHVRIAVTNAADRAPWRFDARSAWLEAGAHRVRPLFVNGDVVGLPVIAIRPREERTLDLYFLPPATVRRDEDLKQFTIAWEVELSRGRSTGRTAFEGQDAPFVSDEPALATGWGARWWADPDHPWPQFYRSPGRIVHRPPAWISVTVPPRGEPYSDAANPCAEW